MGRLTGKAVVIIGGGGGIGRAIAAQAAVEGATLALGDINPAGLAESAEVVRRGGTSALTHVMDACSPVDCAQIMESVVRELGRLDGAVCTVGIAQPVSPLEIRLEDWNHVLAVNLTGAFLVMQAAARVMLAGGAGGSIITFASGLAQRGSAQMAHYVAAKAGIIGLTKSFALALGRHGVRCNSVAPGLVKTSLADAVMDPGAQAGWAATVPLGRVGQPHDLTGAVCFLLSNESAFITGQTLHVNGGNLMP